MKTMLRLIFVAVAFVSCSKSTDTETIDNADGPKIAQRRMDNSPVPDELLTLRSQNRTKYSGDLQAGNLFGRFFCDRAEFYRIDNPQNELYSQRPSTIVLYYLDGELCQTKYELTKNIADRLFSELGRCRIVGLDSKNKQIIKANQIRVESTSGGLFNPDLDNYELYWIIGKSEIRYRVERRKGESRFVYKERQRNYEKMFNIISKYC